jgi:hypothetical protein
MYRTDEEIHQEDSSNTAYSRSKYFDTPKRDTEHQIIIDKILSLKSHPNQYDYYNILGLVTQSFDPKHITSDQIKRSYYKLSMKVHPDHNGDPDAFGVLNEAYSILSNETERNLYDLNGMKSSNEGAPGVAEFIAAFLYVDVPDHHGLIYRKFYITGTILWRILTVAWVFLSVVSKDIWEKEFKACVGAGFGLGVVSYAIWRRLLFTGCLFCFQFSFLTSVIIGFYTWYFRSMVIVYTAKAMRFFYGRVFPLKMAGLMTCGVGLLLMIFQYGFWESLWNGFLIWIFRDVLLGAVGVGLIFFRLIFDSALYAGVSVFISLIVFRVWFVMGWLKLIIATGLGILYTLGVASRMGDDPEDQHEPVHQETRYESPKTSPRGTHQSHHKKKKK